MGYLDKVFHRHWVEAVLGLPKRTHQLLYDPFSSSRPYLRIPRFTGNILFPADFHVQPGGGEVEAKKLQTVVDLIPF